ncbi:MJ0042-type zinc finger domain-containing protein [Maricaulis sp. CAU 1757]
MSIVLSCPSCTTKYRADPQAIGMNGRRVRCASCGHVWAAEVEDPSDLPALQPAPPETVVEEVEKKPHTVFRERQARKRRTMSAAVAGSAWGGLIAACTLLALASWMFRVDIVSAWPRASSAYAAVGAEVNPYGFSVGQLDISRDIDHGVPLLIVEGSLRNFDRRSRQTPGLRAILRDEAGDSVLEWTVNLPAGQVGSGKRQEFRTVVSDPPPEAVEVEVVLVAAAPRAAAQPASLHGGGTEASDQSGSAGTEDESVTVAEHGEAAAADPHH